MVKDNFTTDDKTIDEVEQAAEERARSGALFFDDLLYAKVREWAKKLDINIQALTIRSMKNKWASCSENGNLTFDSELLGFGPEERDYVIVHELLHFSVPNHGRLWKSLMRVHLGEYEKVEKRLGGSVVISKI